MAAGQSLLQSFTLAGHKAINLKIATVDTLLADKTRYLLYRRKTTLIRGGVAESLLFDILKRLSEAGEITYFSRIEITQGIAGALFSSLLEMKLAGLNYGDVKPESFVNPDKGADLLKVWQEYDHLLLEKNLVDKASLLHLALARDRKQDHRIYIIPTNLSLTPLEEEFLQSFLHPENHEPLHIPSPLGLNHPARKNFAALSFPPALQKEGNSFAWLYDLPNLPPSYKGMSTELFHACGESNEVKEIIRRIRDKNLPFDHCALYYTAAKPYTQYLYEVSQQYGIPVTFGGGVSIMNTHPGRFFFALLAWIKDNYSASHFYTLLTSPDFQSSSRDAPPASALARAFRSLKIGWGRDRYLSCLQKEIKATESPAEKAALTHLINLFRELFEHIPPYGEHNMLDKKAFFTGVSHITTKYSRVTNELDAEAKSVIQETLESVAAILEGPAPFTETMLRAEKSLTALQVGRSSPKAGHLHVDSYRKGPWLNRPLVFVAGLDNLRFPGAVREDPILLDVEREKLSPGLELKKYRNRENLYRMTELLCQQQGEVTLSYAAFNTTESRDLFPSPFLLQLYRLKTRDPQKDYASLIQALGERQGFVPLSQSAALDESEWWLNRILRSTADPKEHRKVLLSLHDHLQRGVDAHNARASSSFTVFDGKIEAMAWDSTKPLSASQLESLGKCPFGYMLQYILGIRPPDDLAYDPGAWLDPASRGTLLHSIFEQFYKKITAQKEKPSFARHKALLLTMAEALIDAQKEEYPPPNNIVYAYEKQEMLESCLIFLKSEEEWMGEATPRYFELSFGLRGKNGVQASPIKITLPSGKHFYLRGIIDRVDMLKDDACMILDYKTGSTYVFNPYKYYKGGRQLQHTLYAVALEEMFRLQDPPRPITVREAGYSFPTLKGEGLRILLHQGDRSRFYEILEVLHQILTRGAFVMTDNKTKDASSDCRYCDYPDVCRYALFREAVAEMLVDLGQKDLELLRRLREYD